MMESTGTDVVRATPLWRKIVGFPLVAMLIGVGLLVATTWLASVVFHQIPKMATPPATRQMLLGLALAGLVILVYKFAISKLGETPRDDLRREHSVRDLAFGLGGGALLFSLVTVVAAL